MLLEATSTFSHVLCSSHRISFPSVLRMTHSSSLLGSTGRYWDPFSVFLLHSKYTSSDTNIEILRRELLCLGKKQLPSHGSFWSTHWEEGVSICSHCLFEWLQWNSSFFGSLESRKSRMISSIQEKNASWLVASSVQKRKSHPLIKQDGVSLARLENPLGDSSNCKQLRR